MDIAQECLHRNQLKYVSVKFQSSENLG